MAILEAFAYLFTDEPANFGSATPANVANSAKHRSAPMVSEVANACESLRINDSPEQKQTRFAAIRSHSQPVKPAPECARSQDSQHSHGTIRKTFAEAAKGVGVADSQPAPTRKELLAEVERYCRANTSTAEQYRNWIEYFTELAEQHPGVCWLCVTQPPVWSRDA